MNINNLVVGVFTIADRRNLECFQRSSNMQRRILNYFFFIILFNAFMQASWAITVCGHRGARGLSPENTLVGYRTALGVGVNTVDMDVGMTKDGIVVVSHNIALNPDITKDSQGHWISSNKIFIHQLTFAELEKYDVGQIKPNTQYKNLFPDQFSVPNTRIPSLKQVIDYVNRISHNQVKFQIEIKTNAEHPDWTVSPEQFSKAVVKIIQEKGIADRTRVQAFDYRCLLTIQKIDPRIATAYLTAQKSETVLRDKNKAKAGLWTAGYLLKDFHDSIPDLIASLGGKYWDPEDVELTPASLRRARQLHLIVNVWSYPENTGSLNLPIMKKLIAMNVDGIITDRPDILRGLLAARGLSLPPTFY